MKPASQSASTARREARNPGPSWGYRFLRWCDYLLPEAVFRPLRAGGTAIAVAVMPAQRGHSREYLALALRRRPTLADVWRHFFAFEEALMTKLRVVNGRPHRTVYGPGGEDFRAWLETGGPVLLGTFHIGVSDLLGCQIGGYEHHEIYVVRQRVGNSHDTDKLAERFGGRLHFVWVNEPGEMILALKEAAATPGAIALQCDRVEFAARAENFEFFGVRRWFPFGIYYLAVLFARPVILSVGLPENPALSVLHASSRFDPRPGEPRAATLARARDHFGTFLRQVEALLAQQPYAWFNFLPFNPPVAAAVARGGGAPRAAPSGDGGSSPVGTPSDFRPQPSADPAAPPAR